MSFSNIEESKSKKVATGEIKTILVIEDDPTFLNLVQLKFRRKGHHVLLASDVSEAEEIWAMARNIIDVVISDNRLGYDLGADLLQRFKGQEPNVHYVLCSGEPLEQEVPGIPFLIKPFNLDVIVE